MTIYHEGKRYQYNKYEECPNCDTIGRCLNHNILEKQSLEIHTTLYQCSICGARWYTTRTIYNNAYFQWMNYYEHKTL